MLVQILADIQVRSQNFLQKQNPNPHLLTSHIHCRSSAGSNRRLKTLAFDSIDRFVWLVLSWAWQALARANSTAARLKRSRAKRDFINQIIQCR